MVAVGEVLHNRPLEYMFVPAGSMTCSLECKAGWLEVLMDRLECRSELEPGSQGNIRLRCKFQPVDNIQYYSQDCKELKAQCPKDTAPPEIPAAAVVAVGWALGNNSRQNSWIPVGILGCKTERPSLPMDIGIADSSFVL